MPTLHGFKMFFLLSVWILAGVMAEERISTHYQLKNGSLCLHARHPPPYMRDSWTFGGKFIAGAGHINPNYTEKVDYNHTSLSLCLKELTDADAGIYELRFDSNYNAKEEKHKVIVQDVVPRPVITMSVVHSNRSAGFCKIKVNCSIWDDWVLADCDEQNCISSQESFNKVNISILSDNRTVVCSGNNHLSTNNVTKSMATTCFSKSKPEQKEESQPPYLILIVIAVCLFLCAFLIFMAQKASSECCHQEQASNARLIPSQSIEVQSQPEPRASTSSSSEAEVTYENVDASQPRQTSSPREEMGSMPNDKVDTCTVYSILQAPNVAAPPCGKSDGSRNKKGHDTNQEASTSQAVIVNETESPAQIDTVYSVLQKPTNVKSQHHQQVTQEIQER